MGSIDCAGGWNNQPAPQCAHTDLKELQVAAPSHCNPLGSPRLPVQLLRDGYGELVQDCYPHQLLGADLRFHAAYLVLPATIHATRQIPRVPKRPYPPTYQTLMRGKYSCSPHDVLSIILRSSSMIDSSSSSSLNKPSFARIPASQFD